jgi:alginate O-acetyltransferase complex protein AlgI
MLFNSFTYLIFLPTIVLLYWVLPRAARATLLLIASYVFYMHWNTGYGLLILALTIANFFFGIAVDKYRPQSKQILTGALVFNLGCLCFFKYADFLLTSLWPVLKAGSNILGSAGSLPASAQPLNILLPLGISFFVFEFIHYLVDVYRGTKPLTNFWPHQALSRLSRPAQAQCAIRSKAIQRGNRTDPDRSVQKNGARRQSRARS